ncbi:siderophore ferric iron reductase [Vibrio lamellibrachiae]|uniref:siderophore ferric iron reductase n=1 Tax=Vibrio lamellibrachiae TaxID=2910253 RepID=UPI003D10291F
MNKKRVTLTEIEQLMHAAKQVTPYLDGKVAPAENGMLMGDGDNRQLLTIMYQEIQSLHPEAKHSYWLTRTFSLLSWQPIYLAFIGIYGLKVAPDFSTMSQHYRNGLISGFHFDSGQCVNANKEALIIDVGQQLGGMVSRWQAELDELYRCRPGFSRQLLADFLLMSLIKVHDHFEAFTQDDVHSDAKLWLDAFQLPHRSLTGFSSGELLTYTRKSCCLVTQTKEGRLCDDCPKNKKRRHV